jgi:hypothetical protein
MSKIKLPADEFVTLLRRIADEVELYKNKVNGYKTGWDEFVDSKYGGLHGFLLNWKRAEAAKIAEPPQLCHLTGLKCLPGCDGKECAGLRIPLSEWPQ